MTHGTTFFESGGQINPRDLSSDDISRLGEVLMCRLIDCRMLPRQVSPKPTEKTTRRIDRHDQDHCHDRCVCPQECGESPRRAINEITPSPFFLHEGYSSLDQPASQARG